jgi:phosphatidylglycerol:prolipoprotein diacylglycerol transferase
MAETLSEKYIIGTATGMTVPARGTLRADVPSVHLVFETLGYAIGGRLYLWLRRREGDRVADHARWSVIAAAAVGGAIGSKLLYLLEDPAATLAHAHNLAFLLGGKSIVGGLLGGLIAVELTKWAIGVRRATGDLFAVPLAVGIAVGRIGCLLTGLPDRTHGVPTRLPWGWDYGDGIPRHPTQIYEMAFLLALAALIARGRGWAEGDRFKAFMVGYLAFRVAVDAIKPGVPLAFGLTAIQWAALAGLLYYAGDIARWLASTRARKGASRVVSSPSR